MSSPYFLCKSCTYCVLPPPSQSRFKTTSVYFEYHGPGILARGFKCIFANQKTTSVADANSIIRADGKQSVTNCVTAIL